MKRNTLIALLLVLGLITSACANDDPETATYDTGVEAEVAEVESDSAETTAPPTTAAAEEEPAEDDTAEENAPEESSEVAGASTSGEPILPENGPEGLVTEGAKSVVYWVDMSGELPRVVTAIGFKDPESSKGWGDPG